WAISYLAMRRVHGMELARLGARPPRSLKSSTGRSTPLSPILLSRPGLSSREARCLAARPPTSRSSSRTTRQNGQRGSGGPTSSLNDHTTFHKSRSANGGGPGRAHKPIERGKARSTRATPKYLVKLQGRSGDEQRQGNPRPR